MSSESCIILVSIGGKSGLVTDSQLFVPRKTRRSPKTAHAILGNVLERTVGLLQFDLMLARSMIGEWSPILYDDGFGCQIVLLNCPLILI